MQEKNVNRNRVPIPAVTCHWLLREGAAEITAIYAKILTDSKARCAMS